MEHFNVAPSCTSGLPLLNYSVDPEQDPGITSIDKFGVAERLAEIETQRPAAFVWNVAMAYAAQDMGWRDYQSLIDDMVAYLRNGAALSESPETQLTSLRHLVENSEALGRTYGQTTIRIKGPLDCPVESFEHKLTAMAAVWVSPLFVFSQAHPRSEFLTSARFLRYTAYAKQKLGEIGVIVADGIAMSQTRWEDAYDGLHYMRSTTEDPGHGLVSSMFQQVILNSVFGSCPSPV
eukprot:c19767_g1_i2.p1 GENE.c19767_g1_i2~~c19767_g1_i2.p1  ORF type:complete len:235 (+),score=52.82 c19767_g1_i2:77-781(+)